MVLTDAHFQCEHYGVLHLPLWQVSVPLQAGLMGITLLGGPNTFIRFGELVVCLDSHFKRHSVAYVRDLI